MATKKKKKTSKKSKKNKKSKKDRFSLTTGETLLLFKDDGNMELYYPTADKNKPVSTSFYLAFALVLAINDKKLGNKILDNMDKTLKNTDI